LKQEYFLEDDNIASKIANDLDIWKDNITTYQYSGPRANSFSTMLTSCHIFGYDHPEALEIYPNGFYSENFAFVPKAMYERMLDCEPLAMKNDSLNSYWNLAGLIFIPFLTKMVEHRYEVKFSEEDKDNILYSALKNAFFKNLYVVGTSQADLWLYDDSQKNAEFIRSTKKERDAEEYCSEVKPYQIKGWVNKIFSNGEPTFVTNEEVALLADKLGLSSAKFIRQMTTDNSFIDYALTKNNEIYDFNHPFSKLIDKVLIPINTIDLLEMDKESYQNLVHNLPDTKAHVLYRAFNHLAYTIVKESNTQEDLVRRIGGVWSNYALQTLQKTFSVLLNNLYEHCVKKFPSSTNKYYLSSELSKKMAHMINSNPDCSYGMREILINNITKYSNLCSTVRTVLYYPNGKSPSENSHQ
jgi:hypothetical protein